MGSAEECCTRIEHHFLLLPVVSRIQVALTPLVSPVSFSLHSYAASHQPFILVPGANHAQTSNGVPNYARGDIAPTVEYAVATEQLSHAIASFVTSHQAVQKHDRQAAADELLVMVRRTAEMLGPYFMASGMCTA